MADELTQQTLIKTANIKHHPIVTLIYKPTEVLEPEDEDKLKALICFQLGHAWAKAAMEKIGEGVYEEGPFNDPKKRETN